MRIRMAMLGTGTDDDPFRVPLPVYGQLQPDYASGTAIVEVPDSVAPTGIVNLAAGNSREINGRRALIRLTPGEAQAWQQRLNKAYPNDVARIIARPE